MFLGAFLVESVVVYCLNILLRRSSITHQLNYRRIAQASSERSQKFHNDPKIARTVVQLLSQYLPLSGLLSQMIPGLYYIAGQVSCSS